MLEEADALLTLAEIADCVCWVCRPCRNDQTPPVSAVRRRGTPLAGNALAIGAYRPRTAEHGVFYRVVQEEFETFLTRARVQ